jgi:hypothetical protein
MRSRTVTAQNFREDKIMDTPKKVHIGLLTSRSGDRPISKAFARWFPPKLDLR